jgi:integrase
LEEYRSLIRGLPSWIEHARDGKSREMRLLLRDYVLILANTGIREGTEADNLLWQHVHVFQENGKQFLELSIDGKMGRRDIICRANTLGFLKGTVTKNLRQTFKAFLKAKGLLVCSRTGQNRTLYSLRHTYATFALTTDGMEIHTLAKQMGTSIKMIEDHYSHLTPRLKKDMLTGPRYELHTRKAEDGSIVQSEMPKDEDW